MTNNMPLTLEDVPYKLTADTPDIWHAALQGAHVFLETFDMLEVSRGFEGALEVMTLRARSVVIPLLKERETLTTDEAAILADYNQDGS